MEKSKDIKAMVTETELTVQGTFDVTMELNGKKIKIEYFCGERGRGAESIATGIDPEDMEYMNKVFNGDSKKVVKLLVYTFYSTLSMLIEKEGKENVLEELKSLEEDAKEGQRRLKRLYDFVSDDTNFAVMSITR